ncbi:hypothetical protein PIB30_080348 [Stylosanthes scabra]|uniref:GRF-type domain-containing protein n=1 Tax=Stylosanthes scabra TaxID=79078 RepID=A0ABU6VSF2_9FABA|nr:hypothetical protein [Stylosanthes scabra]
MIRSSSHGSGNCSRSRSNASFSKSSNRGRFGKVPSWCGCGLRPVLHWSGTELNPERPFYGCPNYNTAGKRWCGLFVWADGDEEDEMDGNNHNKKSAETWKINLGWRISTMEDEIKMLKLWNGVLNFIVLLVFFVIVGYGMSNLK